jgi:hypothetical protein
MDANFDKDSMANGMLSTDEIFNKFSDTLNDIKKSAKKDRRLKVSFSDSDGEIVFKIAKRAKQKRRKTKTK